jgi:uncharacterized protein (TIGR02145 family)
MGIVPNTNTFTLQNVNTAVIPSSAKLSECFADGGVKENYDSSYRGSKDRLSNFRNYNNILTDIDGNTYTSVVIGTIEWLVQNFKATKYSNGSSITNVTDTTAWAALTTEAYCWFNNDMATYIDYGALYNWYAVSNPNGLAYMKRKGTYESGWRVAADSDWDNLLATIGASTQGYKIREVGTAHWNSAGGTNIVGFTAYGAGYRSTVVETPSFKQFKNYTLWWGSEYNATSASYYLTQIGSSAVSKLNNLKRAGYSVRLCRTVT